MEVTNVKEQWDQENPHKNRIHKVLAHSYIFSFILFLFGFSLDFLFPVKIFGNPAFLSIGVVFLLIGTFLIFWAQRSSRNLKKENMGKEIFCRGPYCYTRSPTHLGLFISTLGFGIIINALFVVIFSIISFVITRIVFIKKEENILAMKYGTPYLEYKKSVKF